MGSLGGYFGPLAVGYLDKQTGDFQSGILVLALALLFGGAMTFLLDPRSPTDCFGGIRCGSALDSAIRQIIGGF